MEEMKAHVVAAVADNHSGIQLALKEFCEKYPKVFRIRYLTQKHTFIVHFSPFADVLLTRFNC